MKSIKLLVWQMICKWSIDKLCLFMVSPMLQISVVYNRPQCILNRSVICYFCNYCTRNRIIGSREWSHISIFNFKIENMQYTKLKNFLKLDKELHKKSVQIPLSMLSKIDEKYDCGCPEDFLIHIIFCGIKYN